MHETMGTVIQQLRKAKAMTQEQLANLLGVSSAAVSKWETGNALPDVALLCPLARALGCTVNDLVNFRPQLTAKEISTLCAAARRLFEAGEGQKAEELCEARLREYPGDLNLAFRVGSLYAGCRAEPAFRLRDRAARLLEQAADLPEEELRRTILQTLAGLYTESGRYEEALKALDHLPSCNLRGKSLRAAVLQQMGQLDTAAQMASENLRSELEECRQGMQGLAQTCLLMGKAEAAATLQQFETELLGLQQRFSQLFGSEKADSCPACGAQ